MCTQMNAEIREIIDNGPYSDLLALCFFSLKRFKTTKIKTKNERKGNILQAIS